MKYVAIAFFMIEVSVVISSLYSTYLPAFAVSPKTALSNPISNRIDASLYPLFSQLSKSVVQVVSMNPSITTTLPSQNTTTEVAAGFVYDRFGHIVTANHILGGATEVAVIFKNGDTHNAIVIGRDPYTDIAVLRVVDLFGSNGNESANQYLVPVTLANSSTVKIGDYVTTIGYPFASKIAMTSGIVSQTAFLLSFSSLGYLVPDTIETDVAVNPGNSGSPLIDMNGEVIGLIYGRLNPTTAPLGEFSGLSVAIPSNAIVKIVPSLIQNGTYIHPNIGITGSTLTVDLAKHFQNIPDSLKGVVVDSILRGGTADKAGINAAITDKYGQRQLGDIITSLDGHKIPDIESFLSYIQEHKRVGESISFVVYRDGNYVSLNSTLQPVSPI
ncbi:MAG TPA: trypsin-like peptidase domain-containing protein [Nitrososphaeraceae archaeon]|jgi:S1-C subfamily serine protease